MKIFIFCFLLAGSALAVNDDKSLEKAFITANLNDYIDEILPSIVNFMINNDMDPMEIPDFLEGFSVKPLLITYHGELELTKGSLTNLRSLQRAGDFIVQYTNKLFKVSGDFEINKIEFTYDYLAKIMDIGPTGGVLGTLSRASIYAEFLIDFNNNEIHLQDFYFHDIGSLNIKLTGNLLDFISNAVIKVITTLFKNTIIGIVESNMKTALEDWIKNVNSNIGGAKALMEELHRLN